MQGWRARGEKNNKPGDKIIKVQSVGKQIIRSVTAVHNNGVSGDYARRPNGRTTKAEPI